jgi:hypothetical protein
MDKKKNYCKALLPKYTKETKCERRLSGIHTCEFIIPNSNAE